MSDELRSAVSSLMGRAKSDLGELVAFRSVANPDVEPPQECAKAAQWVVDAFTEVGLQDVTASETIDGSKAVYGIAHGPQGSPTVLLYCHYDVQPALSSDDWQTPAWELTEKDGRWYGRGSADCKGNIVMHLTTLRALQQVDGSWPCTIKVISEGSEEQGTGGLDAFVVDNPDLLRADAICIADSGNCAVGVPTLSTSLRGMILVDLKLEALASVLHSGMFGGAAPDPLIGLIEVLASLHDAAGNTTVDGIDNSERWSGADYEDQQFRADAQILDGVEIVGDGSVAEMLWVRPSVTVLGIDVPKIAESAASIYTSVSARVSLRIQPGLNVADSREKLIEHMRSRVPWGLKATITDVAGGEPFMGSLDGPAFDAMKAAMGEAFGREMTTTGVGASIPLCSVLTETFPEAEIMLYGVEEPKSQIHAPNESVDPSEIENFALTQALFLKLFAASKSAR